ncbi:4'-phosphopantetheinyl transferase EntD (siderophore biosynthesis) [Amycolatopsis xylanica]|uniref:4'-phosphopantetheinyl transferase EntD (Siderophore biosynthesis) n=1 Tax=Amycolatopsis xylanica TaxID=589385 RepID=A0A1H3PF77_9PSEU|nr:4'-phosphopantetheinyl transferase superfamily protein [Amycolatopsis xylanica]SDY99717.1 4'-phosphopantetheinyl transferase EntD (siderophore biosynthesis) [Amycolatopsis xylanica]
MLSESPAIGRLIPAAASAAEIWGEDPGIALHPAERVLVQDVGARRLRTFTTARTCARRALAALGHPPAPILRGPSGEPLWPNGIIGSITHCDGYSAAVVARAGTVPALGIDAEPHRPLTEGLLPMIATRAERDRLARLPDGMHWDRLVFCVKEAVYKAWFPLTGQWLDFHEADVTIDPAERTFTARLLVPGPRGITGFAGAFTVAGEVVIAAVRDIRFG